MGVTCAIKTSQATTHQILNEYSLRPTDTDLEKQIGHITSHPLHQSQVQVNPECGEDGSAVRLGRGVSCFLARHESSSCKTWGRRHNFEQ